jgi:hypothetical protein
VGKAQRHPAVSSNYDDGHGGARSARNPTLRSRLRA